MAVRRADLHRALAPAPAREPVASRLPGGDSLTAAGYDVVVVGSGTSGGTVAARLSEDERCRVLLLEAGPDFPDEANRPPAFVAGGSVFGERGAGSGSPIPDLDWLYLSEPMPDGRRVPLPRGKLVGGSSMTNGCIAVRGRPSDFAGWVEAGATGWGWDDLLPWFEAAEREIPTMRYPEELWLPFQRVFVRACAEIGFRLVDDFNAPDSWDEVAGPFPRNRRNEIRQGTLVTYIRRARPRPNFSIRDRVLVDRVLHDGARATGVRVIGADGSPEDVHAGRVVLSAGAYGSAPILLRSGIGPADDLRALGIEPVLDLPVGVRLLEHPAYHCVLSVPRGLGRGGFPALAAAARGMGWWGIPTVLDEEQGLAGITFCLGLLDGPDGSIRLRSADPAEPPDIRHGYLGSIAAGAFDQVRHDFQRLLATGAFTELGVQDTMAEVPFDERLRRGVTTSMHPAGGCEIGRVVDPELSVYGLEGLTVADAGVFPRHVSNNPNMTCHVVGERAAAFIADRARPATSTAIA